MTEVQTESGAIKPAPIASGVELVRQHFTFKEAFFPFSDADSVEDFLWKHPFLVDMVLEAREQIHRYFGAECTLALQPFYDPEDPQFHYLEILIRTQLPVQEELRLLEQLDEGWWYDASSRAQGWLNISLG